MMLIMANIPEFTPEELTLITSVPYCVGIWISLSDDNDSTKFDDKKERKALELAISRMASLHRKMPFAAYVMKQIESRKREWGTWQANLSEGVVLEDLQKALALCQTKVTPQQLKNYKHTIWQTAVTVAQAHGEHVDPDNEMHVDRFFASMASLFKAPKLSKAPENMSVKEKVALKKIRAILKN